jgi:predicted secreted protein
MANEGHIEIRARVGVVEFELPETPSTGYLWRLIDVPSSVSVYEPQYRDSSAPPVAGGSGARVFRVEAPTPGRFELRLGLQRPWEPDKFLAEHVVTLLIE